jgi:hypothetical protein
MASARSGASSATWPATSTSGCPGVCAEPLPPSPAIRPARPGVLGIGPCDQHRRPALAVAVAGPGPGMVEASRRVTPVPAGGRPSGVCAASTPGGGMVAPGRYGRTVGRTNRSNRVGLKYRPTTRATPRTVPDLLLRLRALAERFGRAREAGLPMFLPGTGPARHGEGTSILPRASSIAHWEMRPLAERRTIPRLPPSASAAFRRCAGEGSSRLPEFERNGVPHRCTPHLPGWMNPFLRSAVVRGGFQHSRERIRPQRGYSI